MAPLRQCTLKENLEKELKKWLEEYAKEFNEKVERREDEKRRVEMEHQNFVLTY